jgi:hypothetical protein
MALVSTCYGTWWQGSSTTDSEQVGALISRKVPPTKTEKVSGPSYLSLWEQLTSCQAMRRRLAEMREESAE